MKKVKNKAVNVRKQLKVKLENTAADTRTQKDLDQQNNRHTIGSDTSTNACSTVGYQWSLYT